VSAPDRSGGATATGDRYGAQVDTLTLAGLKERWNEVLYDLEAQHRTAWLAMFDGRLARLDDGVLTLDFSDATKLSGGHGYERANKPQFVVALADAIERVTGHRLEIVLTQDG
jgi:hypothetical protein